MKLEHQLLLIRTWAYRQLPAYRSWLALALLNVCHRRGGGVETTAGPEGGHWWTWQRSTFQLEARQNMAAPDRLPAPQLWAPNYRGSITLENTARTDWGEVQINTQTKTRIQRHIKLHADPHIIHTHTHRFGLIHLWQPEAWLIWLAHYFFAAYKMYLQP